MNEAPSECFMFHALGDETVKRSVAAVSPDETAVKRGRNEGVLAVIAIAEMAAARTAESPGYRHARSEFAAEALPALAEAGRELLIGSPQMTTREDRPHG